MGTACRRHSWSSTININNAAQPPKKMVCIHVCAEQVTHRVCFVNCWQYRTVQYCIVPYSPCVGLYTGTLFLSGGGHVTQRNDRSNKIGSYLSQHRTRGSWRYVTRSRLLRTERGKPQVLVEQHQTERENRQRAIRSWLVATEG